MSRDQMLSFRVTREEFIELQRAAAKAGLSVGDIIRLRVFRRRVDGYTPGSRPIVDARARTTRLHDL